MLNVTIDNLRPNDILDMVHMLKREGYQQGVDFDYAYYPEISDSFSKTRSRHTIFSFYNEHLGMMFKLKHG